MSDAADTNPAHPRAATVDAYEQREAKNMDAKKLNETLELHSQNIAGLMDNQLALAAQVHVMQAALATTLLHHPERTALLATFRQYMKLSRQAAPQLADRMEALEAGMIALLGGDTH
jgi:hypothetical protein